MRPEDLLQEKICGLLDLVKLPYYSIPNGANQTPAAADVLKRTGLKRGIPDLHIPVPVYHNGALLYLTTYLETKVPRKYPPPHQREWHTRLKQLGHCVEVVKTVDQAIMVLQANYPEYVAKIAYLRDYKPSKTLPSKLNKMPEILPLFE